MPILNDETPPGLPSSFARELGAQERLLYLYSKEHHRHFCIVGELVGLFDEVDLVVAVRKVQGRHPNLSYAVHEDVAGPHFVQHRQPINITFVKAEGGASWREVVQAELARPFFPWVGPLLRMNVVQDLSVPERMTVVVTFHHAIADGLSGIAFLNDLVAALNGAELSAAVPRRSVEDLVLGGFASERSAVGGKPMLDSATLDEIAGQPLWRPFKNDEPQIASFSLGIERTAALVKHCRTQDTTVHGALCAALALANTRLNSLDYSILSPIDIRRDAAVTRSDIGLFVTAALVRKSLRRNISFWEAARTFTDELSGMRKNDSIAQAVQAIEITLPSTAPQTLASGLIGSRSYDAVISNLGVVTNSAVGPVARLDAVWGPMVLGRIMNERMIGAATFEGSLRLTESRPKHLSQSLDRMVRLLADAADLRAF